MKLLETVTPPSKRIERQTTPSFTGQMSLHKISAFSSKGKVLNRNKTNSSIKPKKFHSKYVYFGGRKIREDRKIWLKICLSGFPEMFVMGSATTAARKVVLSSTLTGPFEFEREREQLLNLSAHSNFKWTNQS